MANFDSNQWYHLHLNDTDDISLAGAALSYGDGLAGPIYFGPATGDAATQQNAGRFRWQIYPVNDTSVVLRSEEGKPDAFLSTTFSSTEPADGHTWARLARGNITDSSVYWMISPWGDGTFFMTNSANGTAWHLEVKPDNATLIMSSNTTRLQPGQRWRFSPVKIDGTNVMINDKDYSAINLPSSTLSTPASIMSTATLSSTPAKSTTSATPTASSTPPSRSGSSTRLGIGLGVGLGGLALIIASVLAVLWFLRRRKRSQQHHHHPHTYEVSGDQSTLHSGHQDDGKHVYNSLHEAPAEPDPAELETNLAVPSKTAYLGRG